MWEDRMDWKVWKERIRTGTSDIIAPPGRSLAEDETGDVPGWVLVTLMTAGADVAQ